jgi:hypothetical protein
MKRKIAILENWKRGFIAYNLENDTDIAYDSMLDSLINILAIDHGYEWVNLEICLHINKHDVYFYPASDYCKVIVDRAGKNIFELSFGKNFFETYNIVNIILEHIKI